MTTGSGVANDIRTSELVVDHATGMGSVRALACGAVTVDGGTSLAVMGPSGCGKSTLLSLLAGLAQPTRGTVRIGGVSISSLSERERVGFRRQLVGMVYQDDNLLPHLTVEENVGLQLAICRGGAGADPDDVLARLGLGRLAKRLPDQLSGGQRQRVAVARAVIHRPAVILADEPTGALDADNARLVLDLLLDVQRQIGATLVVVTHDQQVASHLDRVIRLTRRSPTSEQSHAR
ncbi:ABC transporter ATP-binding protein [Actinophytocola sp.]|uniref:ABC transporter ATP-binding protein n=1 Tax=Actinophytocola sp. TaxID=1872138 RepID=UPI002EDAA7B7